MPHFMIVLILYLHFLNLSWMIKCLFLRNMEPLTTIRENRYTFSGGYSIIMTLFQMPPSEMVSTLKGKNVLTSFQKGTGMPESKQEVTKVVAM